MSFSPTPEALLGERTPFRRKRAPADHAFLRHVFQNAADAACADSAFSWNHELAMSAKVFRLATSQAEIWEKESRAKRDKLVDFLKEWRSSKRRISQREFWRFYDAFDFLSNDFEVAQLSASLTDNPSWKAIKAAKPSIRRSHFPVADHLDAPSDTERTISSKAVQSIIEIAFSEIEEYEAVTFCDLAFTLQTSLQEKVKRRIRWKDSERSENDAPEEGLSVRDCVFVFLIHTGNPPPRKSSSAERWAILLSTISSRRKCYATDQGWAHASSCAHALRERNSRIYLSRRSRKDSCSDGGWQLAGYRHLGADYPASKPH